MLIRKNHGFGTRRVPPETRYDEVYNQPNVVLVDINETPIERITPTGIKTGGAEYGFDIIIYATGFDAITGSFDRIDIRGVDVCAAEGHVEARAADLSRRDGRGCSPRTRTTSRTAPADSSRTTSSGSMGTKARLRSEQFTWEATTAVVESASTTVQQWERPQRADPSGDDPPARSVPVPRPWRLDEGMTKGRIPWDPPFVWRQELGEANLTELAIRTQPSAYWPLPGSVGSSEARVHSGQGRHPDEHGEDRGDYARSDRQQPSQHV